MKILLIRFSSIGDIVLTTPIIRCLKKQLNAEVHFLTKSSFKGIVASNSYVDKVHVYEDDLTAVAYMLKKEKFDVVIDLHHNLRSRLLKFQLGIKSYSFDKINFAKWLLVNFKINILPKKHIVDRYFDCCKALGIVNDQQGLDYFIPVADEVDLATFPENFQKGYIGLVIGAQHATKRLPLNKLQELCQRTTQPVLLLGGAMDEALALQLVAIDPNRIVNACGKYSLNQSASLVKQASAIVSHDTGLMHIAAAFNKEIHSIWGNTLPDFGMSPYLVSKQFQYEVKSLNCRPCSKIGFDKCPKGHFLCMQNQNINELVQQLER